MTKVQPLPYSFRKDPVFECSSCGKEEKGKGRKNSKEIPEDWTMYSGGRYCSDCSKKIKQFIQELEDDAASE